MREFTKNTQELYDKHISLINKYVNSKKRKQELIDNLDELIDELMNPFLDIDEALEYFGGGKE